MRTRTYSVSARWFQYLGCVNCCTQFNTRLLRCGSESVCHVSVCMSLSCDSHWRASAEAFVAAARNVKRFPSCLSCQNQRKVYGASAKFVEDLVDRYRADCLSKMHESRATGAASGSNEDASGGNIPARKSGGKSRARKRGSKHDNQVRHAKMLLFQLARFAC